MTDFTQIRLNKQPALLRIFCESPMVIEYMFRAQEQWILAVDDFINIGSEGFGIHDDIFESTDINPFG